MNLASCVQLVCFSIKSVLLAKSFIISLYFFFAIRTVTLSTRSVLSANFGETLISTILIHPKIADLSSESNVILTVKSLSAPVGFCDFLSQHQRYLPIYRKYVHHESFFLSTAERFVWAKVLTFGILRNIFVH